MWSEQALRAVLILLIFGHSFEAARLGLNHDEVSGSHAMMMLTAVSTAGKGLVDESKQHFSQQWPLLLQLNFQHLQPDLVLTISQLLKQTESELSAADRYELAAFAHQQRGFDVCQIVLSKAISLYMTQPKYLSLTSLEQGLCIMLILQQRPMSEVAKRLELTGKAQVIKSLRNAMVKLLD